jgi:hypothetical protein
MDTFFIDATFNSPLALSVSTLTGNIIEDMENMGLPTSVEGYLFTGCAYVSALIPNGGITSVTSFTGPDGIRVTSQMPRDFSRPTNNNGDFVYTPDTGYAPTFVPRNKPEEDYGDFNMSNIEHCPDPELAGVLRTIAGGYNDFKGHFINLAASYQVKALKSSQISSYFASVEIHNISGTIFEQKFGELVKGIPKVVDDDNLRGLLKDDKWMDYRLTFASSGGLLKKFIDECPDKFLTVFSENTITAINEYSEKPWDHRLYRAIPEKALAVLYSWQKATNNIPDNFFGPTKAYNDLSTAERISLDNWFKLAVKDIPVFESGYYRSTDMPSSLTRI